LTMNDDSDVAIAIAIYNLLTKKQKLKKEQNADGRLYHYSR